MFNSTFVSVPYPTNIFTFLSSIYLMLNSLLLHSLFLSLIPQHNNSSSPSLEIKLNNNHHNLREKKSNQIKGLRMSCNGCRVLRKGCSDTCVLRSCLHWIESPKAQGNAVLFLAKFFGRSDIISFVSAVPESQRPGFYNSTFVFLRKKSTCMCLCGWEQSNPLSFYHEINHVEIHESTTIRHLALINDFNCCE